MTIESLIKKLENEFEDLEPGILKPETNFRETDDWDSINALVLIALVDTEYGIMLTGDDMRSLSTVQDLYNLIVTKTA